jgi:hypothetical protein
MYPIEIFAVYIRVMSFLYEGSSDSSRLESYKKVSWILPERISLFLWGNAASMHKRSKPAPSLRDVKQVMFEGNIKIF